MITIKEIAWLAGILEGEACRACSLKMSKANKLKKKLK